VHGKITKRLIHGNLKGDTGRGKTYKHKEEEKARRLQRTTDAKWNTYGQMTREESIFFLRRKWELKQTGSVTVR
jgi:hypothetical protein